MEVGGRVKFEIVVLLSVAFSIDVDIGLERDWITTCVAQKLEIHFIVPV